MWVDSEDLSAALAALAALGASGLSTFEEIPRDWVSEDGFLPNEKFIEYARPLIEGEVKAPTEGGLPKYIVLAKSRVEKKLPPRA